MTLGLIMAGYRAGLKPEAGGALRTGSEVTPVPGLLWPSPGWATAHSCRSGVMLCLTQEKCYNHSCACDSEAWCLLGW